MLMLKPLRWAFLCVFAHTTFTISQNISISEYFFLDQPLSVVAVNPTATTFFGTYTVQSSHGPKYPITIGSNFITVGPSTAASTNIQGNYSATVTCVLTRSLTTGTCVQFYTNVAGFTPTATISQTVTFPPEPVNLLTGGCLTITAGQELLLTVSYVTCAPTNSSTPVSTTSTSSPKTSGATTSSCSPSISTLVSTAFTAPTSTLSISTSVSTEATTSTSGPSISTSGTTGAGTSSSTPPISTPATTAGATSATSPTSNTLVSNGGSTPTTGLVVPLATGAAPGREKGSLGSAAIAVLAAGGAIVVL